MRWLACVSMLLFLVPCGAALTPGEHVLQYIAFIHTQEGTDGSLPETSVTLVLPHSWEQVSGVSVLEVRTNYITRGNAIINPAVDFDVLWDGVAVPNCGWRIEGSTVDGLRMAPTVLVFCDLAEFQQPGSHTIEVQRSNVVGTPVTHSVTSVVLLQQETVSMDIQIGTTFDATIILSLVLGIAFLGVIVWARAQDLMLQVLGSVLVYFATLIALSNRGTWDSMVALAIVLGLAASYLLVRAFLDRATTGPAGGLG